MIIKSCWVEKVVDNDWSFFNLEIFYVLKIRGCIESKEKGLWKCYSFFWFEIWMYWKIMEKVFCYFFSEMYVFD